MRELSEYRDEIFRKSERELARRARRKGQVKVALAFIPLVTVLLCAAILPAQLREDADAPREAYKSTENAGVTVTDKLFTEPDISSVACFDADGNRVDCADAARAAEIIREAKSKQHDRDEVTKDTVGLVPAESVWRIEITGTEDEVWYLDLCGILRASDERKISLTENELAELCAALGIE